MGLKVLVGILGLGVQLTYATTKFDFSIDELCDRLLTKDVPPVLLYHSPYDDDSRHAVLNPFRAALERTVRDYWGFEVIPTDVPGLRPYHFLFGNLVEITPEQIRNLLRALSGIEVLMRIETLVYGRFDEFYKTETGYPRAAPPPKSRLEPAALQGPVREIPVWISGKHAFEEAVSETRNRKLRPYPEQERLLFDEALNVMERARIVPEIFLGWVRDHRALAKGLGMPCADVYYEVLYRLDQTFSTPTHQ